MKKSIEILFTARDEQSFSNEILAVFPHVAFIDDMYWPTQIPPFRASITDCESKFVYIWNRELFPELGSLPRKHGGFHGPQSGIVIQLIRSQLHGDELMSGTMSVGFESSDEAMKAFVEGVWKILKTLTPKKVVQTETTTSGDLFHKSGIRLGSDAYKWFKADESRFLRFCNSQFIYLKPVN